MRIPNVLILVTALLTPAAVLASAPADLTTQLQSPELPTLARTVPLDGSLRVDGVDLGDGDSSLVLQRFRVFAPGARVVIHTDTGDQVQPAPANAYFRGYVEGRAQSLAFLTVLERGGVRGMVAEGSRYWVIGETAPGSDASILVAREVDATELAEQVSGFACDTDKLDTAGSRGVGVESGYVAERLAEVFRPATERLLGRGYSYSAKVGIETDNEFLSLFGGDTGAATDYIGDVIGYGSAVYVDEVDTSMEIVEISLWTSTDPWVTFSTICGLYEFGKYWNDNNGAIDRTIAHFMSGKPNGGGVAWVGVLCSGEFNVQTSTSGCGFNPTFGNYGGAYGYSGTLDGDFDIDNPTVVWDIVVTSHEIGHNFNSPHTHCYENIGGSSQPIDMCYGSQSGASCYNGSPSLPCGTPGAGCGTIMSYCHLLGGGIANIGFTLGLGHPWGVMPERVPQRMNDHVVAQSVLNPGCLDPINIEEIFTDGFESGDTSAWSNVVVD